MKQLLFSILIICLYPLHGISQTEVLHLDESPYTSESLIINEFVNNGIDIINVTYTGDSIALGQFNYADPSIGINQGIALSSGNTKDIFGINCDSYCTTTGNLGTASSSTSSSSDPDLVSIMNSNVFDAAILEIEFIPSGEFIEFNYLFASEEYESFTCSGFNDGFGILLRGPGISGPYSNNSENIAYIPGTYTPVSINTVNGGTPSSGSIPDNCILDNNQYFINNTSAGYGIESNGFTVPFTAYSAVTPGETYIIKIVIGDGGDAAFDSSLLLDYRSFNSPSSSQPNITTSNAFNNLHEACDPLEVTISIPNPSSSPVNIPYSTSGDAILDTDYTINPSVITIPAGSTYTTISIEGIEDAIQEGNESISISLEIDPTNPQIISANISDDQNLNLFEYDDLLANCGEDSLVLSLSNSPNPPVQNTQSFTDPTVTIFAPVDIHYLPLDVVGIPVSTIQPNMSMTVSVNIENTLLYELLLWIISPDGTVIPLTSYNGVNQSFVDAYGSYQFNFNKNAERSINDLITPTDIQNPPINWLPEGDFNLLNGESTNGTWQLALTDPNPGFAPTLNTWSISFEENPYSINYSWSPSEDMACPTCPEPSVEVTGDQMYYVTISDSNGCIKEDSLLVTATSQITQPVIDSVTIENEGCNGELGSIEIHITGDYEAISWSTGQDSSFIDNLTSGMYTATIENYCEQDIVVSYTIEPGLDYELTSVNAPCDGTGSASITSTAVYDITWSDGSVGNTISGLVPGIYSVTVSNTTCTSQATFEITEDSGCTPDISGTVFLENNSLDCAEDANTTYSQYRMISLSNNGVNIDTTFSNINGDYTFPDLTIGNYNVVLENYGDGNTLICPSIDTINVDIPQVGSNYENNDYWLAKTASISDFNVNIVSFVPPRPDENNTVIVNCQNYGGAPLLNNTMVFSYPMDQTFLNLVTSSSMVSYTDDAINHEVTIQLPDMPSGDFISLILHFNTSINANLGDLFTYTAEVNTSSEEIDLDNNVDDLITVVVNSYDPNSKEVSPIGLGETGGIRPDQTLMTYRINFQNEGTADALQVILRDEIDTEVFDITTIRFLESSHDFTVDIENGNKIIVLYEDINLVPKSVSEEESQGYIMFDIELKAGLPLGTEIKNGAGIYFDTNEPIWTNITLNTIENSVGVEQIWLADIDMYPNPTKDELFITSGTIDITSVRIIDGLGKLVLFRDQFDSQAIPLSQLAKGIYFVQVETEDGRKGVKKLTVIR